MIYCFVVDNGLNAGRTFADDQITFLDMYKAGIEVFARMRQREIQQSKIHPANRYLLFTTSSEQPRHQLTDGQDQLATLVERVKTIRPAGWSDWDSTFAQLDEYLALLRLSTMQDTLGQGMFMSMVDNTHIFILSDRIPSLLGSRRAAQPQPYSQHLTEIDTSWLFDLERSDSIVHLTVFDSAQSKRLNQNSVAIKEFKKMLDIINTRVLLHSYGNAISLGEQIMCLESTQPFLNLLIGYKSNEPQLPIRVHAFHGNSGFWCFPETLDFLRIISTKKSKLAPKTNFISLQIQESQKQIEACIPDKFPIDQFSVEVESSPALFQFLHLNESSSGLNGKREKYFDLFASTNKEERPFGYLKITSDASLLVLLPWDFYSLFEIINEREASPTEFPMRLFQFLNEKIPKNYVNPLKSALKYFGVLVSKLPYPVDEGYVPECIANRTNLANSCKKILSKIHQEIQSIPQSIPFTNSLELPTPENLHLLVSFDNINEKFVQLSKLYFSTIDVGYERLKQRDEKTLVSVSKMGDFYRNLNETLRFRDPYEDEAMRHEKVLSLFSNPFKRKRKLPAGDEEERMEGRIKRLPLSNDKSEDDEFAAIVMNVDANGTTSLDAIELAKPTVVEKVILEPKPDCSSDPEVLHENEEQRRLLFVAVKNPGNSIRTIQSFLSSNNVQLSNELKGTLIKEAGKFKKSRLIEYLSSM